MHIQIKFEFLYKYPWSDVDETLEVVDIKDDYVIAIHYGQKSTSKVKVDKLDCLFVEKS